MRTLASESIQIKYLVIQIVNQQQINHGTTCRYFRQIQRLAAMHRHHNNHSTRKHRKTIQTTHKIHQPLHQAVSIHIKYHSLSDYHHQEHSNTISFRHDQQHANQVYSINFFTINKDDEMALQHSTILGNVHRSLSLLVFVMFWLDSY